METIIKTISACGIIFGVYKYGIYRGKELMKLQMEKLLEEKDQEIARLKAMPKSFAPLPKQKNIRAC
jgi:hypothetical protein